MVCNRCKMAVQGVLQDLKLPVTNLELGEAVLQRAITATEKAELDKRLAALGFELIDDRKSRQIEQIKKEIIALVQQHDGELKTNLSDYLAKRLHHDYNQLSNLFSEVEGITIEKYFISQKIEKVKELLVYDELSLSEIAFKLNYSSVAHLSNQFKKVTGFTPSHFKKMRAVKRKPLDEI